MWSAANIVLRFVGHLDWLRLGLRTRFIRFWKHPYRCAPQEFSVPFFGATYTGNLDTYIDWNVFFLGAYAKEELRLIGDFLATIDDPVMLDVGANVGHHTLFAASRCSSVVSFEPFAVVAAKLKQRVAENRLANVTLCEFALGEKNETAIYNVPQDRNTGTGTFAGSAAKPDSLSLPIRNGDEVISERGIRQVDFVKIDTESFEPFVLRGLRDTLTKSRPLIFFEWSQGESKLVEKREYRGLFPEDYLFFEFICDTVVLGLFRRPTYRLRRLEHEWPDGNLFAVPLEYIAGLEERHPSSAAFWQLSNSSRTGVP